MRTYSISYSQSKPDMPTVGFCGLAGYSGWGTNFAGRVRAVARRTRHGSRELTARERALMMLAKDESIISNFVIRDRFWGGVGGADGSPRLRMKARLDYVHNMVESDYILCARGGGNFSYRLYETLSAGRIPVFIDTDCVLPYDDLVDWKQHCVWIDESEIPEIGAKILDFHAGLVVRTTISHYRGHAGSYGKRSSHRLAFLQISTGILPMLRKGKA